MLKELQNKVKTYNSMVDAFRSEIDKVDSEITDLTPALETAIAKAETAKALKLQKALEDLRIKKAAAVDMMEKIRSKAPFTAQELRHAWETRQKEIDAVLRASYGTQFDKAIDGLHTIFENYQTDRAGYDEELYQWKALVKHAAGNELFAGNTSYFTIDLSAVAIQVNRFLRQRPIVKKNHGNIFTYK